MTESGLWNHFITRITYFNKRNGTIMVIQHINKFYSTRHQVPFHLIRPRTFNIKRPCCDESNLHQDIVKFPKYFDQHAVV